jgi:ABC-type lipoprotein release transport system permease subunit
MIVALAWRNVWRNKIRSLSVILALTMGLFGALFMTGMSNGMVDKWIKNAIDNEISDIQIHDINYLVMEELGLTLSESKLFKVCDSFPNILSSTARLKSEGMAMTANNSTQVTIFGIDTLTEKTVTGISSKIIEGTYLETKSRFKPILISRRLGEKLKVRMKSKIIFTLVDKDGNISYENFKVNGIYNTNNSIFDKVSVFVRKSDLRKILNIEEGQVHEMAIRVVDKEQLEQTIADLSSLLPEAEVRSWKKINPMMDITAVSMEFYKYILVSIVLIALIFGIINTMLMVILERTKEIGMLRALGMKNKRIAMMITLETIFLCLVGGVFGNILTFLSISYFGKEGMHFEKFKEGMEQFGMSADIYPSLEGSFYFIITSMVVFAAIFSSIFPIIRAFKLNPALAIRD